MLSQMKDALVGSTQSVLVKLANFLPAALALLIAIALFALIGAGLSWLVRRLLGRVKFDERADRGTVGVSDWSPSHSPTLLVGRIVFWACTLLGVVVGISAFDAASSTYNLTPFFLPYLAHGVGAFLIAVAGIIVARYLSRSILINASNAKLQYARLLSLGAKYLVLVFTGAMVLDHIGIGGTIVDLGFGILFGGMVLTLALAVGLGSREVVARSIERSADRSTPIDTAARTSADPARTIRHF
ncbi:hypothetical protein [Terriglobus aquaticus]|uniref:Uncharacterized protein n=1 Tax=Terriglobus aquaticus TaxID=940139 RepID=A0ABW9KMV0_9BACT|nr:hypothetical protein [Terriglobus aquaticus]